MISYEQYEPNIKIHDKYDIKNVNINKSVIYNGNIDLVNTKIAEQDNSLKPLAAAVIGIHNTAIPLPQNLDFTSIWTDADAQEAYLNVNPTSYLILGKPGLGSYTLGESLSKKLNCVHLSSRNIILEEIDQKSQTGRCLDFNMRHNKVCKFDVILAIMDLKIKSSVVKHRGYVVSGLPLVTSNKKVQYYCDNLYTEESLLIVDDILYHIIWSLKGKNRAKQKLPKKTSQSSSSSEVDKAEEEEIEEEQQPELETEEIEEPVVEIPKYLLDICNDIVFKGNVSITTKKAMLLHQSEAIFNFSPDIIINIMSPDCDTLTKKSRKYYNYISHLNTFNYFHSNIDSEMRWPFKYTMIDYNKPYDSHIFNPKYNCKQPINFECNSLIQICNYKKNISPFLEQKLKDYNSKYILKIDGRSSVHEMLHHIMGKLPLMPIKPVLIPKPIYLDEPPENPEEFWNTIKQFNSIKSGVLNFNRYESLWYTRCPVELKKRRSIQGKSKLAVSLFKHVYLLSSLDAMISFCKNPRPYLKLKYLEPTCRMIIIGTKSSGKSMIANCLSWLFDTPILCYNKFFNSEKEKKYDSFSMSILSEIIATIEDARFMKWQSAEIKRTSSLNNWLISIKSILNDYIALFEKYLKKLIGEELDEGNNIIPKVELKRFEKLKANLSFLPVLDNLDLCKEIILDTNLLKYAPVELTSETVRPTLPVLGEKDVTEAISAYIVANDLQKDIEPTTEELMNEIIQILSNIDKECMEQNKQYGKFIIDGFPSDPEFWEHLAAFKLLPDYTIVLIENKEVDIELLNSYVVIDKSYKNYQERYNLSSDPLVKLKHQYKKPEYDVELDVKIVIHDLLNNMFDFVIMEKDNVFITPDMLASFNEAIDKFREGWESVKIKLEENFRSNIVVEIENKSDIEILDEVLLKLRQSYFLSCQPSENPEIEDKDDEFNENQDMLTYNDNFTLGDTSIYCPVAYYEYNVIWEGKSQFCTEFNNKSYYFSKEECLEMFQKDVTKYQSLNKPFKHLPPLRICVVGCIGTGKTTLSKQVAKELGLIHIDFSEFVNCYLLPKHFKKVGRKYENSFKDAPIDDDAIVEFQVDEENDKLDSDILASENEIRRILYNYFEKGVPLMSSLTQKVIKILWNTKPFSRTGFVLDGFPRLPNDMEDMIACFCVPDLVIDLQGTSEKSVERLSSNMMKKWKMQLNDAKNEAKAKLDKERRIWFDLVTKEVVLKLIVDEIINNVFSNSGLVDKNPETNISQDSVIIDAHPSGSANVDANLFYTFNKIIKDYPEPADESQWEKAEDVVERINTRLESIYEVDDENIQTLKEMLFEQKIKNLSVNGMKTAEKVFRSALLSLTALRNRNESIFEQTFIIRCDIAETLLIEGFYLISKFNRMCPVLIFEHSNVLSNPYNINKRTNKIFPVIHRCYIYFMSSIENVKKFRNNPLKYINSDAIMSYREYPLRIAIIGPPKSGKSELASKLSKHYGLMCISRGQAIRHVLKNMGWSELALNMERKLQMGECIDNELIMNAVHTVTIDYRVVSNGFVFDGFPDLPMEATELLKLGLYPLIVIYIDSSSGTILKSSQNEVHYPLLKWKPPYPETFIHVRYNKWQDNCYKIKELINSEAQNLFTINGDLSMWQCLRDSIQCIEDIIRNIKYYLLNVNAKIVPAGIMCFSNETFEQRMSCFKNFCPICLRKNILRHNSFPVDKKGLVQFGNNLYWFCPDHMALGLSDPEKHLLWNIKIPQIPIVVKAISPALLYEDGICMVTYADNLPSQKIIRGDRNFAASYNGKHYLFCNMQCLRKFLEKPHLYYDISVFKETSFFPKISLNKLPNLGYLEQTLGNILTKACCYINVTRPKYPGLNIQVSGLLYVALYLKIHNPNIAKTMLPMYEKAYRKYEARCKLIHDVRFRLRSMNNPFAKYPENCGPRKLSLGTLEKSSSIVSTPNSSTVSEIGFSDDKHNNIV